MANPLLLDLVNYFVGKGLAIGDGEDCFRDFAPETPDSIIALHEYKGDPAVAYDDLVNRSVQITARDRSADIARRKVLEMYEALREDSQLSENLVVHFSDERWGQVYLRQTPYKIRVDADNRVTYGFNIGITTTIE